MIVEGPGMRARIVKGWAFLNLSADDEAAVRKFLETGDTADLPARFQRDDYSVFAYGRVR